MDTIVRSARRRREQLKRLGQLTEAQAVLGWAVILILGALLGAIYLNQASQIATLGRRVQFRQNELDELKRENAALERNIAEAQSLERLQQEATRLGFRRAEPTDIEYIVVSDYPSVTAAPAATAVPEETVLAPQTIGEVLQLMMAKSFNNLVRGEAGEQ